MNTHFPPFPRREGSMMRDDIVEAEPLDATEPMPEELLREFRYTAELEPGDDQELFDATENPVTQEPGIEGYRPPWLAQSFLPMAPPLVTTATLRALAGIPLPLALL